MLFSSNYEIKTTIETVINQHATLSIGLLLMDIERQQSVAENRINRICVINLMQMYVSNLVPIEQSLEHSIACRIFNNSHAQSTH